MKSRVHVDLMLSVGAAHNAVYSPIEIGYTSAQGNEAVARKCDCKKRAAGDMRSTHPRDRGRGQ